MTMDDPETQSRILDFYLNNPDQLQTDLNNSRVMVVAAKGSDKGSKESGLYVHKEYEDELLRRLSEEPWQGVSVQGSTLGSPVLPGRVLLPQIPDNGLLQTTERALLACSTITSLIDNGEFIHGYQMYLCLEPSLRAHLEPQTTKVWTRTYIDLLSSMGFYRKAAHVTKHSAVPLLEGMNQKKTTWMAKCAHCKAELEPMKEGVCGRCAKDRKCSICLRSVKGLSLWCQVCGHGGHFHDVKKWFSSRDATCATGCGHVCFRFYE